VQQPFLVPSGRTNIGGSSVLFGHLSRAQNISEKVESFGRPDRGWCGHEKDNREGGERYIYPLLLAHTSFCRSPAETPI
jgi:hypothetical protein